MSNIQLMEVSTGLKAELTRSLWYITMFALYWAQIRLFIHFNWILCLLDYSNTHLWLHRILLEKLHEIYVYCVRRRSQYTRGKLATVHHLWHHRVSQCRSLLQVSILIEFLLYWLYYYIPVYHSAEALTVPLIFLHIGQLVNILLNKYPDTCGFQWSWADSNTSTCCRIFVSMYAFRCALNDTIVVLRYTRARISSILAINCTAWAASNPKSVPAVKITARPTWPDRRVTNSHSHSGEIALNWCRICTIVGSTIRCCTDTWM